MDLINAADFDQLIDRERGGLHISMFMPTHYVGDQIQADQLRWRGLIDTAAQTLTDDGHRSAQIDELLEPARALHADARAWQHMSDGLALFIRPGWHEAYRVPINLPATVAVGDRFLTGPLHPIVTHDNHFLVLAISQRQIRLLEGSRHRVEEIELRDIPADLRELTRAHDSRLDTMARLSSTPRGGRTGRAVFYGHGPGDENLKDDEFRAFLRRVSDGLHSVLRDYDLPMVLAGLDASLAIYRGINDYAHVTEKMIHANPDDMTAAELHSAAWPIIAELIGREHDRALEQFHELHGTGRTATDLAQIQTEARNGRVQTLITGHEPWHASDRNDVIRLGAGNHDAELEQLDDSIVFTLSQAGRMYAIDADKLPENVHTAAIFRY